MNIAIKSIGYLFVFICFFSASLAGQNEDIVSGSVAIIDSQHYSHIFADSRKYRIFFPPSYQVDRNRKYPVIYFFHGWAQRYFGEMADGYSDYEKGDDNGGDNIAAFVAKRDVIVIKIDGLNQFSSEDLNLTPYNIGTVSTFRQFPLYFIEFVKYIDETYRTIPDRDHRAVSGLSMGGFMTYWISGKYPDLVCGAGNFCGSLEMRVGPSEFPVEYNHIDMHKNYEGVNVRFHYGTRDRLRYYHYDLLKVWPQVMNNYQYHVYDASHVTCGLGDMFEFLYHTFKNPLPNPPNWHHIDVYPNFEIWDYDIKSDRTQPGFTILDNVNARGFKSAVRPFLPDGEPMSHVNLVFKSPPVYSPNFTYTVIDINSTRDEIKTDTLISDREGRLMLKVNGDEHHIGINKTDDLANIEISQIEVKNMNWAMTNRDVVISVGLINKGLRDAKNLKLNLTPVRDYVVVKSGQTTMAELRANRSKPSSIDFSVFVKVDSIEMALFRLVVEDEMGNHWIDDFSVQFRKDEVKIDNFVIADGGMHKVVNGGIDSLTGIVGSGNGDGIANPGETIVLLVEHEGNYYRTNAYSSDPNINPNSIHHRVTDSWSEYDHIGGGPRFTMPVITSDCPNGKSIDFWVEYWLPNSPEHIIKRGTIQIKVEGERDMTPPIFSWLEVTNDKIIQVKLSDGAGIESVRLRLIPDQETADQRYLKWDAPEEFSIMLNDEAVHGDKIAGDSVFSLGINGKPSYFYKVEIIMMDSFHNEKTVLYEKSIFLQDTN
ncbi:MAG: hypothetical protein IPL46_25605 [Saprospiraceae bacterium]|nr:hypothetical protein [Saprospiraceae bacterium]